MKLDFRLHQSLEIQLASELSTKGEWEAFQRDWQQFKEAVKQNKGEIVNGYRTEKDPPDTHWVYFNSGWLLLVHTRTVQRYFFWKQRKLTVIRAVRSP